MRFERSIPLLILVTLLALGGCKNDGPEGGGPGGGKPGGPGKGGGGPPGAMQMSVEAVTITTRPLTSRLSAVGSLRADESVTLRPEVAGRILRIGFQEGERVDKGQVLFVLDSAIAEAELREAQANLAVSDTGLGRAAKLGEKSLVSKAEVDKLRADVAVMQARTASATTRLAKTRIRAPFAGNTGLRDVSVGEYITAGQSLVNLVRLDPIEVDFSLPETQLAQVSVGQTVTLVLDAFPGRTFSGEVVAIDPVINATSRSAHLRARVDNAEQVLRPGLSAQVSLGVGEARSALLMPEQALMQQGDTRFVYTVVKGKAKKIEVRTGLRLPGEVEIVSGLNAGDQVITAGQAKSTMHEGADVMVLGATDASVEQADDKPGAGMGSTDTPPAGTPPGADDRTDSKQ